MKIVYISNSTIPSRAANSIHVMKVCQAFSDLGHEITLFASDKKNDYEKDIIDIYQYYGVKKSFRIQKFSWLKYVKGKSYFYGLLSALKSSLMDVDLVFCRHLYAAFFSSLICKKVIFESHSPVSDASDTSLEARMFKSMISKKSFSSLVVITHSLKEYYLEKYPQLSGKVIVAPDGADPVGDEVKPLNMGADSGRIQVGYLGHLYPGRGIDIIIELASLSVWADFHIIGGTEADISYWKNISKNKNIYFHGFVTPNQAERMRISCDVLLAPYQSSVAVSGGGGNTVQWMSPLKVFEYMAAGKLILCSDLPVLHEVLEHNRNALFCNPVDANDWAKKLDLVRSAPHIASDIGNNALKDFAENYSWYSRVESILKEIN